MEPKSIDQLLQEHEKLSLENEKLKSENAALAQRLEKLESLLGVNDRYAETNNAKPALKQNAPNPFNTETVINFQLPQNFQSAMLVINDQRGNQIRTYTLKTNAPVTVKAGELASGSYSYSLIVDGVVVDTKQMILTK